MQLAFLQDEQGYEGSSLSFRVQLLGAVDVPFSVTAGMRRVGEGGSGIMTATSQLSFTGAANQTLTFSVPTLYNTLVGQGDLQFGVVLSALNVQCWLLQVKPYATGTILEKTTRSTYRPNPRSRKACRPSNCVS